MTPDTELERLFADMGQPKPLAPELSVIPMRTITLDEFKAMYPGPEASEGELSSVDCTGILTGNADIEINNHESIHGICAQGDCDDE